MKVTCLQENLSKGLLTTNRIISSKSQLPILGNILISAENNQLKLSATNLETGINSWVGAKVEEEGGLAIPARTLTELVASLPAGKVSLEAEADLLRISCGGFKASLNGFSAKDFPVVSSSKEGEKLSLSTNSFVEAVSQVVFAAAQDEGRPALAGVKWTSDKEKLTLAATDGYRLSIKKITLKNDLFGEGLILPARALVEAVHIAQEKEKKEEKPEISIFFSPAENQVNFSFQDVEITSRLIEGDFPDFSKIIPQSYSTKVLLDKDAVLKGTRVASVFARDSANIIRWEIKKGRLTMSANSPQVGENTSEIEVKTDGEEGEIAFNFRFLLDLLNAVKDEEIIFEMSGPLNPGVFKSASDDSFLHIIMPVRVQG